MKGVLAILGLVACATAFQYTIPQSGMFYGRPNQAYDNTFLSGVRGLFYGPYNRQFYQKRFGVEGHEYQHDDDYQQVKDSEFYHKKTGQQYHGVEGQEYQHGDKYHQYKDEGIYHKKTGPQYHGVEDQEYEHQTKYFGDYHKDKFVGDDEHFAKKQQDVYRLVKFINNPVYDGEYQQIFKAFDLEKYAEYYQNEAFETFMHLWTNEEFLPRGEIFSIFTHEQQAKALFKLFYTAKDYETFFKTAVWARQRMNEGLFLYTFSVAVIHRPDTQGVVLPAIYEIYPHYFFNSEVMQKAYHFKMSHYGQKQMEKTGVYTIKSNYSGHYLNLHPEQSLSYYLEDVGLNAFYYYFNLYYPFWMESSEYHMYQRRGELFYYLHQQLLARYYLERLSHGIGGFEYFNWEVPFETGYYPSLTYPNGLSFAERPNFANLQEYFQNYGQRWCFVSKYGYGYTYVNTFEQRIREAIDIGFAYTHDGQKVDLYTPKGMNMLGNIIEGNADSPNYRYYGSYVNFARHLLGYAKQPLDNYKIAPAALEHFETSMRDPAFYKLFKKVTLLFQKYKTNLPAYTKKDLFYPGVKVEKVEVDPMVTYYDQFHTDITNGLTVTPEEYATDSTFKVQVEQYRLNYKNFNYKVYVNSDKDTKAFVRVYIGPKYDEHGRTMDFYENRVNFFEIDHITYNLKEGQNMIVRNSKEFTWYKSQKTNYLDVYKHLLMHRFILPRGTEAGLAYQFYVIVYPYMPYQGEHKYTQHVVKDTAYTGHQETYFKGDGDNYPLGYPFDRPAEFDHVYFVPNAYMKDVKIYHKVLKTEEYETSEYVYEQPKYFM